MVDKKNKEEDLLLDHEYDGIRELDNDLPPWWINLFYITIIFGVIYLLGYQVFGWFENQNSEYQNEIIVHEELLKKNEKASIVSNNSDDLKSDVMAGDIIFKANCVVCHGAFGEGKIGPNLTDKNWIHGGDIDSIQKSIAEGIPAKGMLAWKPIIGNTGVRQVSRYVMSLQGSNPADAKAAEGSLYEPIDKSKPLAILTDTISLENGSKLYQQYCSACHGADKNGGFASNLNDKVWTLGKGTIEDTMKITSEGNIPLKMPGWKSVLSEKQIQEVSSYILNSNESK